MTDKPETYSKLATLNDVRTAMLELVRIVDDRTAGAIAAAVEHALAPLIERVSILEAERDQRNRARLH